jgi:hypothetical protein
MNRSRPCAASNANPLSIALPSQSMTSRCSGKMFGSNGLRLVGHPEAFTNGFWKLRQ